MLTHLKRSCRARPKLVKNDRRKRKVMLSAIFGGRVNHGICVSPAMEIAKKVRRYASLRGELWRCCMGIEKIVWNVE